MTLHNAKKRFYAELYHRIDTKEINTEEFVNFMSRNRVEESIENQSGFYELCTKFCDISLNAPKYPDPTTCDVNAVFLYTDINAAKNSFKEYLANNKLNDIIGLLEAIRIMHMFAVSDNDPRTKSATITPQKASFESQLGYIGKYHNFCLIPNEMWEETCQQIISECSL